MPQVVFILIYVLCFVLWLAVSIMLTWHLWGVVKAETSVEGQDHDIYRNVAKQRGDVSDLWFGFRIDELTIFLNRCSKILMILGECTPNRS